MEIKKGTVQRELETIMKIFKENTEKARSREQKDIQYWLAFGQILELYSLRLISEETRKEYEAKLKEVER